MLTRVLARGLRTVAVVAAVALPLWVTPDRVSADPTGWQPIFSETFESPTEWQKECTALDGPQAGGYAKPDEVRVADGRLELGIERRALGGSDYVLGGITCGRLEQQYGCYEIVADVPSIAGVSALIQLTPKSGDPEQTSSVQLAGRPDARTLRVVDGGRTVEKVNAVGWGEHVYVIAWDPTGFRLIIDGAEEYLNPQPSRERRTIGFSVVTGDALSGAPDPATLPAAVRISTMLAWAYDPKSSPDPSAAEACTARPASYPPVPGAHPDRGAGRWIWWVGGAVAVVAVIAIVGVIRRRRGPRKLGPGHRA